MDKCFYILLLIILYAQIGINRALHFLCQEIAIEHLTDYYLLFVYLFLGLKNIYLTIF